MNKRGITLIELIAVLAIMALIATILLPNINKIIVGTKKTNEDIQVVDIKKAAEAYVVDNIGDTLVFTEQSNTADITFKQLLDGGYLSREPKDPKTGNDYDLEESKITVTKENNSYKYEISFVLKPKVDTDSNDNE